MDTLATIGRWINLARRMAANSGKNQKKPAFRRRKALSAADVMRPLLDRAIRSKGFVQTEVISRWPQIIGEKLADSTVPLSIRFPPGQRLGGTLHVRCEAAFAPLLQHQSAYVIETVNRYFGYGAVTNLQVRQGPVMARKRRMQPRPATLTQQQSQHLDALVSDMEESPLRQSLLSLGKEVMGRAKK